MKQPSPTVLLVMGAAFGHLNGTFAMSQRLRAEGYRVVYAIHPSKVAYLEAQGFEAISFDAKFFSDGSDLSFSGSSTTETLLHRITDRLTRARIAPSQQAVARWNQLLSEVNPALLLMDSFYPFNYLLIDGPKPPTIFINIMLSDRWRQGVPPLNTLYRPVQGSTLKTLFWQKSSWSWLRLRKRWREYLSFGQSPLSLSKRLLALSGKATNPALIHRKAFYPAIPHCPEIILGPQSLDFDEISPVEQLYLASPVHQPAPSASTDARLTILLERMRMRMPHTKWVYCSLGTLNARHNPRSLDLFRLLIQLFAQQTDWELILSTGEINPIAFGPQRPNIHLFRSVPQYQILAYCDLMITHGGINSVLECIDQIVPMLVFPLNDEWDQNGNAARVEHYGLGLYQSLNDTSTQKLAVDIERLLQTPDFKTSLRAMRERIAKEDNWDTFLQLVAEQTARTTEVEPSPTVMA